jgi:antitoxin component YwqK of YwqJK toxin-antitoxin module
MVFSTFTKNDITFEYYPNTKIIKSVGRYNSKSNKIGYWKYYYPNGQLESAGYYRQHSNQKDYQCKLRRKNGYSNMKQTTPTGWWKYYSQEGNLIKKVKYNKDWITCYECTLISKITKEINY